MADNVFFALTWLFDGVALRFAAENTNVPNLFGWREVPQKLVTGIGGLIYLFVLTPKLAALLLLGIPLILLAILGLGRRVRGRGARTGRRPGPRRTGVRGRRRGRPRALRRGPGDGGHP